MDKKHVNFHNSEIAYHFEWGFKKEAFVWYGKTPVSLNFYPVATEYRNWLLQKGKFTVISLNNKNNIESIKNPYSYSASAIAAILAHSINASHTFDSSTDKIESMQADIERIRLYNELVLYTARFCEVAIKQLLYSTSVEVRLYSRASLGELLASDCKSCRKANKPHKISLLGSLAHRYHLCLPFEHCLFEHLKIVNRRRNMEAAHSDTQAINIRCSQESRNQLMKDSNEICNEFIHMLEHISDLEQNMINELKDLSKISYEQWAQKIK